MTETVRIDSLPLAEPPLSDRDALHVLKQDDLFAVFDPRGDFHGHMHAIGPSTGADGLFQDDTRILSRLAMTLGGETPVLLSSSIGRDNVVFTADLTNPPLVDANGRAVPQDGLHIARRRFLWRRRLFEALIVESYLDATMELDLAFEVDADFRDVFEIRGAERPRRGRMLPPRIDRHSLTLGYRGLDGRARRTAIALSSPVRVGERGVSLSLSLPPAGRRELILTVASDGDATPPTARSYRAALAGAKRQARRQIRDIDRVRSDNADFDRWIERASADLALLVTHLDSGPYPYAGIPWFSVPFGRDAVLTALQLLWLEPSIARGVLAFLSQAQAEEESSFRDAQPGKIMHETRKGEMATLKEVPFARYYGGVDTTPLFVLLAGAYFRRTDDRAFLAEIWPAVHAALGWIDFFGDRDGDGLVEYLRGEDSGLRNQGWKDSGDSVFHADGRLAEGAVALVEVQAYVAAAKHSAVRMARAMDDKDMALRLEQEAKLLRDIVEERFWREEIGTYALALDGDKRPCAVRTSNAGHVLYCGIARPERALRVVEQLMSPAFFSGWGVRTLAEGEPRYNPISYHNGTVWPHDCSLIAAGFARYGLTHEAARVFTGLRDAAARLPEYRLPELFCGFRRRRNAPPVAYPSACTPQAWASGAPFLLLQACLGIDIDAGRGTIEIASPCLPDWLNELHVHDLAVGTERASLYFRRADGMVEAGVMEATGRVELVRSGPASRDD